MIEKTGLLPETYGNIKVEKMLLAAILATIITTKTTSTTAITINKTKNKYGENKNM